MKTRSNFSSNNILNIFASKFDFAHILIPTMNLSVILFAKLL